jgi:hypothetical protein
MRPWGHFFHPEEVVMARSVFVLMLGLILFPSVETLAQEKGQKGFNFGVFEVASVGATLHLTDSFAFRPLVRYDTYDADRVEETAYGADLGFLYFASSRDDLWLYFGGEIGYTRVEQDRQTYYGSYDIDDDIWSLKALFGLQYTLNRRLGVYGEVGARHIWEDEPDVESLRVFSSGIGIIFYFD